MADTTLRGRFVWHELMTRDVPGAKAFYSRIMGWKVEPWAADPNYTVCLANIGPTAGIFPITADLPAEMPAHWVSYIGTRDVDGTVAAAVRAGGSIVKEPEDIAGAGRYAVLKDPQGAVFAISISLLLFWGVCVALSLVPAALRPDLYRSSPPYSFWFALAGLAVPIGFSVAATLYGLYGAYRAYRGRPFLYPLAGRLARGLSSHPDTAPVTPADAAAPAASTPTPASAPTAMAPLGADATVAYGYKDLRFRNILPFPIALRFELGPDTLTGSVCAPLPLEPCAVEFSIEEEADGRQVTTWVRRRRASPPGKMPMGRAKW